MLAKSDTLPLFWTRDWHISMFLSTKAASNLENWSITLQHKDFANSRCRRWGLFFYSWLTRLWLITLNPLLQQCFVILVDISLFYCLQWREKENSLGCIQILSSSATSKQMQTSLLSIHLPFNMIPIYHDKGNSCLVLRQLLITSPPTAPVTAKEGQMQMGHAMTSHDLNDPNTLYARPYNEMYWNLTSVH